MRRFLYFYLMRNKPDAIRRFVPAHVQYWRGLGVPGYVGGPFSDRTGGLITFEADNLEDAQRFVDNDPFQLEEAIEQTWVKEWLIE